MAFLSRGRVTAIALGAILTVVLYAGLASKPAAAARTLSGAYTCLTYGASIHWFQNIVFHPNGSYALGSTSKPYDPGRYSVDGGNIVHFLTGGDKDFLGLAKGTDVYLKFKNDKGPFEKKGFDLTFKCGLNSRQ